MWKKATVFPPIAVEALLHTPCRTKESGDHDYCLPRMRHALRRSRQRRRYRRADSTMRQMPPQLVPGRAIAGPARGSRRNRGSTAGSASPIGPRTRPSPERIRRRDGWRSYSCSAGTPRKSPPQTRILNRLPTIRVKPISRRVRRTNPNRNIPSSNTNRRSVPAGTRCASGLPRLRYSRLSRSRPSRRSVTGARRTGFP